MIEIAKKIIKTLRDNGHEAVLAGGCVRDYILGSPPQDYDIATGALPNQVEELFPHHISIGKSFGVIMVIEDDQEFEVATFRQDIGEKDGRHPASVRFSSMEQDALRRDFTVNGMFMDPFTNKIYDFVGGQQDIKNRTIRFIGNPFQRISEDKLRMLRSVRFSIKLGFEIEQQSFQAIRQQSYQITDISAERIKEEFYKILELRNVSKMWILMTETLLMNSILPEIINTIGSPQWEKYHPEGSVHIHLQQVLDYLSNNPLIKDTDVLFAGFIHDIGKPHTIIHNGEEIHNYGHEIVGEKIAERICNRLKMSSESRDKIKYLVRNHMRIGQAHKMKKSKLKMLMCEPYFDMLLELHKADRGCEISGNDEYFDFFAKKRLEFETNPEDQLNPKHLITGNDLKEAGIAPGPIYSEILNKVREEQLEGNIKNHHGAMRVVVDFMNEKIE